MTCTVIYHFKFNIPQRNKVSWTLYVSKKLIEISYIIFFGLTHYFFFNSPVIGKILPGLKRKDGLP